MAGSWREHRSAFSMEVDDSVILNIVLHLFFCYTFKHIDTRFYVILLQCALYKNGQGS